MVPFAEFRQAQIACANGTTADTLSPLQRIRNAAEARMRRQGDKVILVHDRLNDVNKALQFQIDQRAFFSLIACVLKVPVCRADNRP